MTSFGQTDSAPAAGTGVEVVDESVSSVSPAAESIGDADGDILRSEDHQEAAGETAGPDRPTDQDILAHQNQIREEGKASPYVGDKEPLDSLKSGKTPAPTCASACRWLCLLFACGQLI
jgi:hypothetical protein